MSLFIEHLAKKICKYTTDHEKKVEILQKELKLIEQNLQFCEQHLEYDFYKLKCEECGKYSETTCEYRYELYPKVFQSHFCEDCFEKLKNKCTFFVRFDNLLFQ
jgi:hypothetical protein